MKATKPKVKITVKHKLSEKPKRVNSVLFKKGEYKELVEDPFNLKR